MLDTSGELGPHRPEIVRRIERRIEDAVELASTGQRTIDDITYALAEVLGSILAEPGHDPRDDYWFDLRES